MWQQIDGPALDEASNTVGVSAAIRSGHVLVVTVGGAPVEPVAVERRTDGVGGVTCQTTLQQVVLSDEQGRFNALSLDGSGTAGMPGTSDLHCITGAYVHLGSIPVSRT